MRTGISPEQLERAFILGNFAQVIQFYSALLACFVDALDTTAFLIDGLTDVLISCLDAESKGCRTPEQNAEIDAVRDVVRLLKEEPAEGIRQLLRVTGQVFLNPDDYENRSVISEAEKASLE